MNEERVEWLGKYSSRKVDIDFNRERYKCTEKSGACKMEVVLND